MGLVPQKATHYAPTCGVGGNDLVAKPAKRPNQFIGAPFHGFGISFLALFDVLHSIVE